MFKYVLFVNGDPFCFFGLADLLKAVREIKKASIKGGYSVDICGFDEYEREVI